MLKIRIEKKGIQSEIWIDEKKASPEDLLTIIKESGCHILAFTTWEDGEKRMEGFVMVQNQTKLKKMIHNISKAQIK